MERFKINATNRRCAFCKHWYDPTNSAINPVTPALGLWEYDNKMKCKCLKRNREMLASAHCVDFVCKI